MPFYERQPYIQPLHQIIAEVMRGDIRVPRFQRPGVGTWDPEQRGDLLDSLYRGFPVGTILLWSTTIPIKTFSEVGGFRVPETKRAATLRLVLDGHQRLSTLVQILGPGLVGHSEHAETQIAQQEMIERERWVFELDFEQAGKGSRECFVLLKPGNEPTPTQLPLGIALSRPALNRWIRDRKNPLTDEHVTEADNLRDRLREYSMPVAVLVEDSLEAATESFKRINSSGTPMTSFNMVASLAYAHDFDPQQLFEEQYAEKLAPLGWERVKDSDILRVCAGLTGQNPARIGVAELAKRLRGNRDLICSAFDAVAAAVEILRTCGVHGPEALPYSYQLIILAISLRNHEVTTLDANRESIVGKWFWLTTYGEVFAGVNSAVFDRAKKALADMIAGGSWSAMERDVSRKVRELQRFDFRSARSKASALLMARQLDNNDVDGEYHRALTGGVSAMQLLLPRGQRSIWWHLAIAPSGQTITRFRESLRKREQLLVDSNDLDRLGVPGDVRGTVQELLQARHEFLLGEERRFVSELGLDWST